MKTKIIYCLVICETVLIIAFFISKFFMSNNQEFVFQISKTRADTFKVSNAGFFLYVHLSEDKALQDIYITDGVNRDISITYSDLGIRQYGITDKNYGYEMETGFMERNFFQGKMIPIDLEEEPPEYIDGITSRPVIFRYEKYNNIQKKYTLDYNKDTGNVDIYHQD